MTSPRGVLFASFLTSVALSGCALPLPVQFASLFADGVSLATTDKSLSDHALSAAMERDCALWRGVSEGKICREPEELYAAYDPTPSLVEEPGDPATAEDPARPAAEDAREVGRAARKMALARPKPAVHRSRRRHEPARPEPRKSGENEPPGEDVSLAGVLGGTSVAEPTAPFGDDLPIDLETASSPEPAEPPAARVAWITENLNPPQAEPAMIDRRSALTGNRPVADPNAAP